MKLSTEMSLYFNVIPQGYQQKLPGTTTTNHKCTPCLVLFILQQSNYIHTLVDLYQTHTSRGEEQLSSINHSFIHYFFAKTKTVKQTINVNRNKRIYYAIIKFTLNEYLFQEVIFFEIHIKMYFILLTTVTFSLNLCNEY